MALLGMDSIRQLGLSNFSSSYYWPISDDEFRAYVDTLLFELETLLVEIDQDIADLVIADYRFLMFIIQHIHYRGAWARFEKLSAGTPDHSSLEIMINPSWDSHIQYFSDTHIKSGHFGNHRNTLKSVFGHQLRHLRYTWQVNSKTALFEHLSPALRNPEHLSIGPFTVFKDKFLSSRDVYAHVSEWDFYGIPKCSAEPTFEFRLRTQFLEPYFSSIHKQCLGLGAEVDLKTIASTFSARLCRLNSFYSGYLKLQHPPKEISLTAAGNPLRKTLAMALQRRGTKLFVLHHGDCPGVERYPHAHRNDGSFCNFFVCPTKKITQNFRDNYSSSLLEIRAGTQYITSEDSHYPLLKQKYRRDAGQAHKQDVIMLIGFGMNHTRYLDGAGYFYYFQLDLQYRIAKLIKQLGYKLIYKVHPDRAVEVGDLFSTVADSLETRPFEDVWDSADSYVFTHPGTTVFGQTVLTTRPMLLVDLKNNNWNLQGYEHLKLRCQMVPSFYDNVNRIVFDEMEFAEKLNNPLSLDDTYIDEFLF